MTEPEITGQGLPTAPVPDAPRPSAGAQVPVTDHDPSAAQAPATAAPRRRRWAVFTLVAVIVVGGLVAGLVVWAPWKPPPVLRPAGLVAGPSTANSVTFRWAHPATGPLPDKYLILSDGRAAGTVAGTATVYRQAGLTPATRYEYRVVAVRGGERSPQSAALAVSTLTPPLSQARLQGLWNVFAKNIHPQRGDRNGMLYWDFIPVCAAGACHLVTDVKWGNYSFKLALTRAGAAYLGHGTVNFGRCGPRGNTIPDPATLDIRLHATDAVGEGQAWVATKLAGTMAGAYKYVSSATFYCPAGSFRSVLSGTPS